MSVVNRIRETWRAVVLMFVALMMGYSGAEFVEDETKSPKPVDEVCQ